MSLISPVYRLGQRDEASSEERRQRAAAACREIWQTCGLAVIDPEQINDDWVRQAVINEANRLHGRRGTK